MAGISLVAFIDASGSSLKHSPQHDVRIIHSSAGRPIGSRSQHLKAEAPVKIYSDVIRRTGINPKFFDCDMASEVDERMHSMLSEALSSKARADAEPPNPADGFSHARLPVQP